MKSRSRRAFENMYVRYLSNSPSIFISEFPWMYSPIASATVARVESSCGLTGLVLLPRNLGMLLRNRTCVFERSNSTDEPVARRLIPKL